MVARSLLPCTPAAAALPSDDALPWRSSIVDEERAFAFGVPSGPCSEWQTAVLESSSGLGWRVGGVREGGCAAGGMLLPGPTVEQGGARPLPELILWALARILESLLDVLGVMRRR